MKITRVTAWQLDLPLTQPYFLSGGSLAVRQAGLDPGPNRYR